MNNWMTITEPVTVEERAADVLKRVVEIYDSGQATNMLVSDVLAQAVTDISATQDAANVALDKWMSSQGRGHDIDSFYASAAHNARRKLMWKAGKPLPNDNRPG